MKFLVLICCLLPLSLPLQAKTASEYLGSEVVFDSKVPSPEQFLGYEVGDWHVRPDQLHAYAQAVAASSARVSIETIGHTHEQRPLVLLKVSAAGNQGKLETLRTRHLEQPKEGPLVLYMGFSIHGNEASGSNASMLYLYYLAAAQDPWLDEVLKDTVVLIEPSYNPDGLGRFAHWANSNKSKNLVSDRNNREQNEPWLRGRTNHYWFDLNRDWLLLQHPESQARIKQFHRWRPNLLTDHHEMGSDSTYFFQPGVPTRQNPLTSNENLLLTRALANFHAEALDAIGSDFYSEEDYDDYYYGKGSTYPDINGSLGVLFEQASSRSHLAETVNGPLSFQDTIFNQLTTSLSSLKGAWELRERFKALQSDFYPTQAENAKSIGHAGWIVGDGNDSHRAQEMLSIFSQHQIEYFPLGETIKSGGTTYKAGHAWFFPAKQTQFGLLRAMMETRTRFQDETFYDVSTWNFPFAFDLPYSTLKRAPKQGSKESSFVASNVSVDAKAWLIPWNYARAPRALQTLLSEGVLVKSAVKRFSAQLDSGVKAFELGTLVVPTGRLQTDERQRVADLLSSLSEAQQLPIYNVAKGLTPSGADIGSGAMRVIKPIKPLLLVETPTNRYEAGEVWYVMDTRLGLAPVMVTAKQLGKINLSDYTHLIMVDGRYKTFPKELQSTLKDWVSGGGVLIAQKRAALWSQNLLPALESEKEEEKDAPANERKAYSDFERDHARNTIGGAIVETELDLSHPLSFGYSDERLPLMRNRTVVLDGPRSPYASLAMYTDAPLLSGYIDSAKLQEFAGKNAVIADRLGKGLVVRFADNPSFRAYWYGSQRLLFNALYFGQLVDKNKVSE